GEYVARGLLCKVTCLTMSIADGSRELDQMLSLERKDWPARILTEGRAVEAIVLNAQGRFKEAVRAYEQVIVLMRQAGAVRDTPQWLANLAHFHLDAGEIDLAISKAREVVAVEDLGFVDPLLVALRTLALALLFTGRYREAREPIGQFCTACEDKSGWERRFADVFALFAAREGRLDDAARLQGYADHVVGSITRGLPLLARAREQAGALIVAGLDATTVAQARAAGASLEVQEVIALTLRARHDAALSDPARQPEDAS